MIAPPELSLIVPTHDRRDAVVRLLGALADGDCAPHRFEVIVSIDGSRDGTAEAISALSLPFAVRTVEQSTTGGAARARNLGAEAARGAVLLFIDDDVEPLPGCLAEHLRLHAAHGEPERAGEPMVVIGAPIPVRATRHGLHGLELWGWWEQQFERLARAGHRMRYDDVYSGILSMPASLFSSVGGFRTDLPSSCRDDSELGVRLIERGARIVFSRAAGGLHHETRDRARLIQRKIAEGEADVMLATLHPHLWPALRISQLEPKRWSRLGILRQGALSASGIHDVAARAAAHVLDLAEALHMRGIWRQLNAALMYYWYWRGVRAALGGREALEALAERCCAARPSETILEIDLCDGLEEVVQRIDATRPDSLRVWYAGVRVGTIPTLAGAERLRGEHLAPILAGTLAGPLLTAIAIRELASANLSHAAEERCLAAPAVRRAG